MNSAVAIAKLRIPSVPSMPVDRLDARLDTAWAHRLALVVAPAGYGKTTLLSRFALRSPGPVGWYRAEGFDRDEGALLAHVEAALGPALEGVRRGWESVADAANALSDWPGERILLVIDDLHTLHGTAAEAALEQFIEYAPPSLTFAAASRLPPAFNLPRMRVSGTLLELIGEDLRLRSWEVERLFQDFYAEPLPPEELARLARRTEGWPAGLQLFHLATRGRAPDERRRLLAELSRSAKFARDYLTRNVLHRLPDELRRFMVETSVLGRLSGTLCDRLLGRSGSAQVLAELVARGLFTQPLAVEGEYRYHEVLRSYLHAALLEELDEAEMHERFRAAGELLASYGAPAEAFDAYCRAEDWDSARALLAAQGAAVADGTHAWIDAVPAAVLHDPWLLLASARRLRAEGRLRDAVARYGRAEIAFGTAEAATLCRDERQTLASWFSASAPVRPNVFSVVRAAVRGDLGAAALVARRLEPSYDSLVAGLIELLGGNAATARRELLHAAQRPDAPMPVQIVASLGAGAAGLLMGQSHAAIEIDGAVADAEAAGLDWLARLGRASLALTGAPESLREAEAVAVAADTIGDEWGASLARLCAGWGALMTNEAPHPPDVLAEQFRRLDAATPEAWARAIAGLAAVRSGDSDAREAAVAAESVARRTGVNAARLLAYVALAEAEADPEVADEYGALATAIARETGLHVPTALRVDAPASVDRGDGAARPLELRVFGGFELRLAGREVDLSPIRPRARSLLRLMATSARSRVHHEAIESALWPDADAEASARNLHVAIAAVRRALEPAAARGSFQLIRREGDAYVFDPPAGSEIDIVTFENALASARVARERGDVDGAAAAFQLALDSYRGELLPEEGPAEWVAGRREACRLGAVEATQYLAEILLGRGDAAEAARTATIGLGIERYHDPLWRLLIEARDQAGDQGAATRARVGYDQMLSELGITPASTGSAPI